MSLAPTINVPREMARDIIMEWLMPMTESGQVDELWALFVKELEPYAATIIKRTLQRRLRVQPADDELLPKPRDFMEELLRTFEGISLSPDMMAAAHSSEREITEAALGIRDWIHFLDTRPAASPKEAIVHPDYAPIPRQS